ncbi:MAG: DUF4390 domain-containing protein [Cycloclasticus sp.]|nr:DUF4390 domain-containing protein [Cycloclasticus sp.]MBQ0789082.1 DUF4390 domain-containing protein [Cycloclasticus sp.]
MLLFSTLSIATEPASITVKAATLTLQDQTHLLNASINYSLSDDAIKALNNGITLTFNVELSILEPRRWLWDRYHANISLVYQIKYHTLAETYQVLDVKNNARHSFSRLEPALHALGTLNEIPLHALTTTYKPNTDVSLKAYLNIEALPLPMRPMAYITPGWYLRSDTYRWTPKR